MAAPIAPYYLTGHMAPVPDEISVGGLAVTGALPPELTGRYLRNGPNPLPGETPGTGSSATACCTASGSATGARRVVPQPVGAHRPLAEGARSCVPTARAT